MCVCVCVCVVVVALLTYAMLMINPISSATRRLSVTTHRMPPNASALPNMPWQGKKPGKMNKT